MGLAKSNESLHSFEQHGTGRRRESSRGRITKQYGKIEERETGVDYVLNQAMQRKNMMNRAHLDTYSRIFWILFNLLNPPLEINNVPIKLAETNTPNAHGLSSE